MSQSYRVPNSNQQQMDPLMTMANEQRQTASNWPGWSNQPFESPIESNRTHIAYQYGQMNQYDPSIGQYSQQYPNNMNQQQTVQGQYQQFSQNQQMTPVKTGMDDSSVRQHMTFPPNEFNPNNRTNVQVLNQQGPYMSTSNSNNKMTGFVRSASIRASGNDEQVPNIPNEPLHKNVGHEPHTQQASFTQGSVASIGGIPITQLPEHVRNEFATLEHRFLFSSHAELSEDRQYYFIKCTLRRERVPSLRLFIPCNYPEFGIPIIERSALDIDSFYYEDLQNRIHEDIARRLPRTITDFLNTWDNSVHTYYTNQVQDVYSRRGLE